MHYEDSHRHEHDPEIHIVRDTTENYEIFDRNQRELADLLELGVFNDDPEKAKGYFRRAYWEYTGDTSKPGYLEPEDESPVIEYIADKIDAEAMKSFQGHAVSAEVALPLYAKAYERFKRLAKYKGNPLYDENDLARCFMPMRTIYRQAVRASVALGDKEAVESWKKDWSYFSLMAERDIREVDPEVEGRQDMYDNFQLNPTDDSVWDEVIHQTRHEADRQDVFHGGLKDVPAEELIGFAEAIRTFSKEERYASMEGWASTGKRWSEELPGYGDVPLTAAVRQLLRKVVPIEAIETKRASRREVAVILGAHDGRALDEMTFVGKEKISKFGYRIGDPVAEQVTIVEQNQTLRAMAANRLQERLVDIVDGTPTDLPFGNGEVQLIIGARDTESMNRPDVINFYLELSRVLKNGGIYIEGQGSHKLAEDAMTRWKGLLAQMIVDTIQKPVAVPDRLDPGVEEKALKGLGLHQQNFSFEAAEIRTLTKRGKIRSIGFHAVNGGSVDRLFGVQHDGPENENRNLFE